MQRYSDLFHQITDFSNLLEAARLAQKNKRWNENVLLFNENLEKNLIILQKELQEKSYQPGKYKTFTIYEPKKRMISAAPYRDRVLHHALCNIIAPLFERTFIADSYANRKNFGTHKALKRCTRFARTSDYVLQCDIQKYFPSIDHEILKSVIRRKIKCPDTLWLTDLIIDCSNPQEPVMTDDFEINANRRRGLPVGNLTSQFFANVYLNGLDHFVRETLRIGKYVRYVDDFALFSDDRAQLHAARAEIESFLYGLRLKIHPIKSQLFHTRHGVNFLGFRVLSDRIRLRPAGLRRIRRDLTELETAYRHGAVTLPELTHSFQSRAAHLAHGDTWRLREKLFRRAAFVRK